MKGEKKMHKGMAWLKHINKCVLAALALIVAQTAIAAPLLYDVRYNPLMQGETQLQLVFDEALTFEPKIQVYNSPARIEMLFSNVGVDNEVRDVPVNQAGIQHVTSTMTEDGLKVIVSLDKLKIYKTTAKDNIVTLHVSDNPITTDDSKDGLTASNNYINTVQSIDFRRGEKGEARLLVFLQNTQAAINVYESGGKIIAEFHHTDILDDLLYQLDVIDFGTVVSNIETFKEGNITRIEVEPNAAFKFTHQQIENIFTLTVEKDDTQRAYLDGGIEYQGRPMSLNFQDIPIRSVLQIIAGYNEFNLVTSDSVTRLNSL